MPIIGVPVMDEVELVEGSRYATFDDLETAISKFSQQTNSVYTVFNSKSIEAENRHKPPEKHLPLCLRYKSIKFACKHYGSRRSKSRGLRPNQSSFKIGCPSFIYVAAHGHELVVEKLEKYHSHTCDPELVNLYPERRSLAHFGRDVKKETNPENMLLKSVRDDVLDLLCIGVERKRIRNYVHLRTKRMLWSGDLTNLAKQTRDHKRFVTQERSNQLLTQLRLLESKENVPQLTSNENMKEKLNSLKRKVEYDVQVKAESEDRDSYEHCYSIPTGVKRHMLSENEVPQSDHDQEISETQNHHSWGQTNLEEVVKSILGPNQEGPLIVHLNNYDGVAVVEVSDAHGHGNSVDPSTHTYENNIGDSYDNENADSGDNVDDSYDDFYENSEESITTADQPPESRFGGQSSRPESPAAPDSPDRRGIPKNTRTLVIKKVQSPSKLTFSKSLQPSSMPVNVPTSADTEEYKVKQRPLRKSSKETVSRPDAHISESNENEQEILPDAVISPGEISGDNTYGNGSEQDGECLNSAPVSENSETERTIQSEQLMLIRAKQAKVREEANMLRLKSQKLQLQINSLSNCIEQQSLEKEKVKLEIKLLQVQLEEKQKLQFQLPPNHQRKKT